MAVTLSSRIQKSEEMIEASLKDSIALMSIENGQYYGMEKVAQSIWSYLENPMEVHQIIDKLLLEYGVDREQCEKETLQFLEILAQKKIIEVK